MSRVTVRFLKAALVYFVLGALLGVAMAASPGLHVHLPTHVHLLLLGWMSMTIYGVAYHILPRFSGRPLFSDRLAAAQFWLANIGLLGMAYAWEAPGSFPSALPIFGSVEALSIVGFAYNIWRTIP